MTASTSRSSADVITMEPSRQAGELASSWRTKPTRWGHSMHSMCSYFAMFPPRLPNVLIQWLSAEGDIVYDPFCGRGTSVLEARRLGRVGAAADLNPMALVLARAKLHPHTRASIMSRLDELEREYVGWHESMEDVPDKIRVLFAPGTLRQLLFLRGFLDFNRPLDALLAGCLLGILHLNADSNGRPRGLTVSMPNTFAMAPGYVSRYIVSHNLRAPVVDVFGRLRARLDQLTPWSIEGPEGMVFESDATGDSPEALAGNVRLLLCSPPYLDVVRYGKFNWIRLWFLREEPRAVDARLMATSSLNKYLDFMTSVFHSQAAVMRPDGAACFVIGDVTKDGQSIRLGELVAKRAVDDCGWRILDIIEDNLPVSRKVTRIWGNRRGLATKTDRLLILAPPGGSARLPALPDISWVA